VPILGFYGYILAIDFPRYGTLEIIIVIIIIF